MNRKKLRNFIESLLDQKNWKPNIELISKETGLTRSKITTKIKNMKNKGLLDVQVKNLSESEASEVIKSE